MFQIVDILCPNVAIFMSREKQSRKFYGALREQGATLWFYQCSGPGRLHDPYYYHRLQHWWIWECGAKGSGFWSYGDAGGGTSWMDYTGRTSYSPVYFDPDGVTNGKHWEAVREGIEDYEYLKMLSDAVASAKDKNAPAVKRAAALLKSLPKQVTGTYDPRKVSWVIPKNRAKADEARRQILDALETLRDK
jgi:hypothetical protein